MQGENGKMIWRCVICFVFVALTLKSLLSHINTAHSRSPDFRVVCGIDGCTKEYRVYNSLWYHIRRNHHEHLESGSNKSRGERTTAISSRETSSAVNRNMWAYRPADATVENRECQTDEAVVENRVQDVMTPVSCPAVDSSASCQSEVSLLFPSVHNYNQLNFIINLFVYVSPFQNKSQLDCHKRLFNDSISVFVASVCFVIH